MKHHRSSEQQRPVYVATSLGTHLAFNVLLSDTVSDLKRKLIVAHFSCFPRFGEIKIDALKAKHKGCFYHLPDSILLPTLFKGDGDWCLYVDVSTSAVYCEEIIRQNHPFNCEAHVLQREVLMDARSADDASGARKKLKSQESLKCNEKEEPSLHQSTKGSGGHSREQTADLMELMTKEPDNKGIIIEKKVEKVLPVQEQLVIEAEIGVQSALQSSVDLAFVRNHGRLDEDETNGRAEEDDVSRVSSATNMDQSRSSSKKRKKPSQKKESGKKKIVDKGDHGLEQVDGSQGVIPEAKCKEPANMETMAKQMTDNMALIEKQVIPVDVSDGSGVQKGISLLLGENTELSDRDVANGSVEKGEIVPDSLATGMLKNVSSRDKRKKSANKKDLSWKKMVVLTEEHALKYVGGAPGTISVANHRETDNKESVAEEMIVSMAVFPEQGAVADTGDRGGIQHDPELVPEGINGQVNENVVIVSAMSVDDMGENASAKKRKKSTQRKERSKKRNIIANEENLQKHVDDLWVVSSMGPRVTHNKETGFAKSENVIQANEQALNTAAGDASGVQNEPEQVENNGEFIDDEAIRGAVGVVSHNPFIIGVMEDKSSTKNRKKPTHTKESNKKKALDPDEKHVLWQDPFDKHGPKDVEGTKGVSSLPKPKESDNSGKSNEEKLDDTVIVHEQALRADADYRSEGQNGPAILLQGENNSRFLGDGAIVGTEKGCIANDLLASGVLVDESSKKKTKKSANKPSKKKTVYPEEKLGLKQNPKVKLVLMHVEDSVGANSLAETKEADNKEKSIEEKPAYVVVVHEKTFDDNTGYGVQEENNELLRGDEASDEAEKVNLSPDLLASGVMEAKSSKKKMKSTNKQSKKKTVYPEEKLGLKQDPKEKRILMHVEDSVGANSLAETKEADNKEKNVEEKSADVVVVHEKNLDDNAGYEVQEENNELLHGDEANDEAEKVNLSPDLLTSGVMEDKSSKKKTKKSTNREKLASKQNPKDKVFPQHVEDSTGAYSLTKAKEAANKEKCLKQNSADVVVVHEQIFDTDTGDRLHEENNEHFHGDEATGEVEKVNLAPDLLVSGMVKNASSPTKKKLTQKNNSTSKKTIDSHEDHRLENIESSPGDSSLARPTELVNSKNYFSQAEGNESVTPVSYEKTADGLIVEVNSQETLKRKGMTGAVQEAQTKGNKKQSATDKSVEQGGDINALSEMTKKESQKVISTSSVSKSDNLLSSASSFHTSDGKLEESGSIKFSDYFRPDGPQVTVAAYADTNEVADVKGNGKINPPNFGKNRDSEASASAIEVTKNNKKKHSNLDRYCVAFRNSSHQSLQASVEGQKRSLLDKSGSIFEDESSGGPDDDQGSGKSDATTRTPSDDFVSSDYSDGDSNALMKSRENGNYSHQNGRRSNMKNLLLSGGKDVELTKILQSSRRYKMAKKAASQSQEKDMDGEPVDFVPDSQADV